MQRYVDFTWPIAHAPLHSGNPAYDALPAYFQKRLEPALGTLLEFAGDGGLIRTDITAKDLLGAVANLRMHAYEQGPEHARRMFTLLADGPRYGASTP